jgi:hypothetical protein
MKAIPVLVITAAVCGSATATAQDDDLDVLLDRLVTYLETYERDLGAVIADEHYVQEERRRRLPLSRVTEAEVMFLRLPGEAEWFGIRDVKKVDGTPVAGTGITLADLFKRPADDVIARAAAIVEASSRHNLGGRRTINMPTVPLEALSARNHARYVFKVGGKAKVSGVQTRRLDFHEFDEPTLVHGVDGSTLWTRGSAWVDPLTGALWRAEMIVGPDKPGVYRRPELSATIRVEFTRDQSLQMLVPKEMRETFWIPGGVGHGRGRYTNYRKFTTAARIVGPACASK